MLRNLVRPWLLFFAVLLLSLNVLAKDMSALAVISAADLPPEARVTLQLIRAGGPYPYAKDGVVFGNYEKRLPYQARGYYREFTVKTPGAGNRGARRIIAGGVAPHWQAFFYTDDHYATFRRIQESAYAN